MRIAPVAEETEHRFLCELAFHRSSFVNCLSKSFSQFLTGLVVVLLLICRSLLLNLVVSPLLPYVLQIFILGHTFHFLNNVFSRAGIFNSDEAKLINFFLMVHVFGMRLRNLCLSLGCKNVILCFLPGILYF